MTPDDFWQPWETEIDDWASALDAIENVATRAGSRDLVWRGAIDAGWALHSSLYRRLMAKLGSPPTEEQLIEQEEVILDRCRHRWRFDGLPALTLLAQLQHFGGPTRLLDVSLNPLMALWFAVEERWTSAGDIEPEVDGRLFAFDVTERRINVGGGYWANSDLPWAEDYEEPDWGRGRPWFWVPPSLNERIPAQYSGFLIDGVPKIYAGEGFRKAPGPNHQYWPIGDVRLATSVPTALVVQTRNPQARARPTFTLRIRAAAKPEIRKRLQHTMGLTASTVYPDWYGLARNVLPELPG